MAIILITNAKLFQEPSRALTLPAKLLKVHNPTESYKGEAQSRDDKGSPRKSGENTVERKPQIRWKVKAKQRGNVPVPVSLSDDRRHPITKGSLAGDVTAREGPETRSRHFTRFKNLTYHLQVSTHISEPGILQGS